MLNLIKYVKRMKKLLFFAILALFMCSCEEKGPDFGYLDVYNKSYCSYIFVDVITSTGDIYYQASISSVESFKVPAGNYTVTAYSIGYDKEKTCTVNPGETTRVYFY
jgi:hypothetical protein